MIKNIKCVLIGDAGVGKSTYVSKLANGDFKTEYTPTLGAEIHTLHLNTTIGNIVFNLWDTAGVGKFQGLADGYYLNSDCCIIMSDITGTITRKNMKEYSRKFKEICNNKPYIYTVNKSDISNCKQRKLKNTIYISAKSNLNIYEPIMILLRQIFNDETIEII